MIMVTDERSTPPAAFSITAARNCSLSSAGAARVLGILIFLCMGVVGVSLWMGAWMVLPFTGIEAVALAWAFQRLAAHAHDYERLTLHGDRVVIELSEQGRSRRFEFNRYWTRIALRCLRPSHRCRLALCSHGQEVVFGRHMTDAERVVAARDLTGRLRSR
ncbi:MAG: DUF2244 domain-containing protein [Betaproteobacteria bacterium]|nr:DUF2244 domain-containing protein [Betaproteobacteria bacterium]